MPVQSYGTGSRWRVSFRGLGSRNVGRIDEDGDAGRSGYQLVQERQLLRHQFGIEEIDARQVALWPGETRDKTEPDGILGHNEEDRDGRGCRLCREYSAGTPAHEHHGNLPANQFGRQFGHAIDFVFCPAVGDCHIIAFHITGLSEASSKSAQTVRHCLG